MAVKRLNLSSDQLDKRNIKLSLIYINYRLIELNNIPIPAVDSIIAIDLRRPCVIIIYRLWANLFILFFVSSRYRGPIIPTVLIYDCLKLKSAHYYNLCFILFIFLKLIFVFVYLNLRTILFQHLLYLTNESYPRGENRRGRGKGSRAVCLFLFYFVLFFILYLLFMVLWVFNG